MRALSVRKSVATDIRTDGDPSASQPIGRLSEIKPTGCVFSLTKGLSAASPSSLVTPPEAVSVKPCGRR